MIHTFCILQNGFTFNQWCGSKHSGCARCSSKNCTVYTQNTCNDLLNSWQYGWKITAFQMRSLPKSWCFQGKTLKWVTYPLEVLEMNCKSNDHRHNIHAQLPPPPPTKHIKEAPICLYTFTMWKWYLSYSLSWYLYICFFQLGSMIKILFKYLFI